METIAKRLRIALDASGLTQTELSKLTGITKPSISTYLSGKYEPKQANVFTLAETLDVSPEWLMGRDVPMHKEIQAPANLIPFPSTYRVPVLGPIACGDPIEAIEQHDEYAEVPEYIKCDFALKCKGDSMIDARICDGDIVYIRSQPQVENGQIAAVQIAGEATLKKVFYQDGGVLLMPANPSHKPRFYSPSNMDNDRIMVLGLAVGFTSTNL